MFSRGLCSGFDDDNGVASSESLAPRITRSGRAPVAMCSSCPCTAWMSCSVRDRSCRLRSSEPNATLLNVDSRKSSGGWVRWCFHFTQTHARFYTAWAHVTDPSDMEDALPKLPDKIQTVYMVSVVKWHNKAPSMQFCSSNDCCLISWGAAQALGRGGGGEEDEAAVGRSGEECDSRPSDAHSYGRDPGISFWLTHPLEWHSWTLLSNQSFILCLLVSEVEGVSIFVFL